MHLQALCQAFFERILYTLPQNFSAQTLPRFPIIKHKSLEANTELFGNMVFNDAVMKAKLPKDVYLKLKDTIDQGVALDSAIADVVANAMMDWAMEKGATHYSHWFQPMTGITAERRTASLFNNSMERRSGVFLSSTSPL